MPGTRRDASIESELRLALASDRLELAYHSIVRCGEHTLVAIEALLRWNRPGHGRPVPPTVIIDIAERTGIIDELGLWVLFRSCSDPGWWSLQTRDPLVLTAMLSDRKRQRRGSRQWPRAAIAIPGAPRVGTMSDKRVVELRGPADDAFIRLVRTASVSFASQAGLEIDPCDELRMAADEACRMLGDLGAAKLDITLAEDAGLLSFSVRPDRPLIFQPSPESALILKTMTDRYFLAEGGTIVLEKALPVQA